MLTGKVLIVEDEVKLAGLIHDYLKQAGYDPFCLHEGTGVISWIREQNPVLVLLDLMLPGLNGLDICRELRKFSNVPVIMVTARVEEVDRLLGLEIGADDYICKPFSPREVVARVKAVLRRSSGQMPSAEGLVLDESRFRASLNGIDLELTAVEFRLLKLLAGNPGRIFGRQQLMDSIYPDHRSVCDRTIDSHIKKLRKRIATVDPSAEFIHSLYGAGYKFEVP